MSSKGYKSGLIRMSLFRSSIFEERALMGGEGRFRQSQWPWTLHQMLVPLVAASVVVATMIGPRCHCQKGGAQIAAIACCTATASASCCGSHIVTPETVEAEAGIPHAPGVPCSCHDASPLASADSSASPKPIQTTTQSVVLPPTPRSMSVVACRPNERSAVRSETSSKLCARLCRFLI